MEVLNRFNLGDKVSFQLLSGAMAIMPDSFIRCVVESKLGYNDVYRYGFDPDQLHQLVYPTVSDTNLVPSDPSKYKWLYVKAANGSELMIGEPWINIDTIEGVTNTGLTITCSSSPNNGMALAKQVLTQNGFVVSSIEPFD